jgi:hypothetical protein
LEIERGLVDDAAAANGIWTGLIVTLDAASLSRHFATQARVT